MCSPPHRAVAITDVTIAQGTFFAAARVSSANCAGASYPACAAHSSHTDSYAQAQNTPGKVFKTRHIGQ